jgi:DNA polymerase-3 subunit epsilon
VSSDSWRRHRWSVVDVETTGLGPDAAVVSFAVVPVEEGRVRLDHSVYRVTDPGVALPAEVVKIHGIRPADLATAPPLEEAAPELRGALQGVPAAWSAWVEARFLSRTLGRSPGWWARRLVDVRGLAVAVDRIEGHQTPPSLTAPLLDTCLRFGIPPDDAHHALWDAFLTAQLLVVTATRLEREGLGELRRLRRVARRALRQG